MPLFQEAKKYKKALPARFALTIELRAIVKRRVSKEMSVDIFFRQNELDSFKRLAFFIFCQIQF